MKVNIVEHKPHTEIIIANDSIGIMIDIADNGVSISIDNNDVSIDFMIDHATASDISHKVANAVDDWRR